MVLIGCLACLGSGITSLGFQRYLGSGTRSPQAASLLSPSWTYTLSCTFKKKMIGSLCPVSSSSGRSVSERVPRVKTA